MKIYKLIAKIFISILFTSIAVSQAISQRAYSEVYILPFQGEHLINSDMFFICDYVRFKLLEKLSMLQKDKQIILIPLSETVDKLLKLDLYIPSTETEFDQITSKFLTRPDDLLIFGIFPKASEKKAKDFNFNLFVSSSKTKRKFKFNLNNFTNLNSFSDSLSSFIALILIQKYISHRQRFSLDLMTSFWWYPFKGGVVKTYLLPISFSFTINLTSFFGIRLGGFRYWSKVVQNDFSVQIRPDDPLLSIKTFYGARVGLELKIFIFKLTTDFEQIIPPGKQPNKILPFFLVTSSAQILFFNRFSIGPTITFFKPRELLNVEYINSEPIYQIATYKITYFPGIALGFTF